MGEACEARIEMVSESGEVLLPFHMLCTRFFGVVHLVTPGHCPEGEDLPAKGRDFGCCPD